MYRYRSFSKFLKWSFYVSSIITQTLYFFNDCNYTMHFNIFSSNSSSTYNFFSEATGMFTILSMVLKDHLLLKSLRMITYKVLHVIPAHFGILFWSISYVYIFAITMCKVFFFILGSNLLLIFRLFDYYLNQLAILVTHPLYFWVDPLFIPGQEFYHT